MKKEFKNYDDLWEEEMTRKYSLGKWGWVILLVIVGWVCMMLASIMTANADPLVDKINEVRTTNKLYIDPDLNKLAKKRCVTMKSFSHEDYFATFSSKIKKLGYMWQAENLALGQQNDEQVFQELQASPGHRANNVGNVDRLVEFAGVGRCEFKGELFTVILFGSN